MANFFYTGVLFPDDGDGLFGVTIFGANVNASGATASEALNTAASILQEVITDLAEAGEPLPEPIEEAAPENGVLVVFQAVIPPKAKAA